MTEFLLISTSPLLSHASPSKLMAIPSFQLPKPKISESSFLSFSCSPYASCQKKKKKSYWFYLQNISRIQPTFHPPPSQPGTNHHLLSPWFLPSKSPCFYIYPLCSIPNKVTIVIFLEHKSDYLTSLLKTTHGSHITLIKVKFNALIFRTLLIWLPVTSYSYIILPPSLGFSLDVSSAWSVLPQTAKG